MKMLTILTLVVCITVSSSRAGPPRRCEYFFKNLDADVTIESGRSMYDIIYSIDIGRDQSMGEHKQAYLTEPSEYFMLFENNVMVRNCLPAGLDFVLHVRIDQEPSCEPGFLFISVTYSVPIFERSIADTVITVPCNGRDDVEVMTIAFENKGPCTHFDCTIECLQCFGKFFWIIDGSTVVTEHDDMLFGVTYYVYITCIDSGTTRQSYASKEFHIIFQMSPSCLTTTSTQQTIVTTPLTTISTRSRSQSTLTTPDMKIITSSVRNLTSATGSTMRAVSSTLSLTQTTRSQPSATAAPIYSSTIISNTSTTATTLMTTSKPKQPSTTEQFPTTKSTITTTTHVTTSKQKQATTTRTNPTTKFTTAITNMTTSKQNQATTKGQTPTTIPINATTRLITPKPKQATTTGQNPTTKSSTTATRLVATSKPNKASTTRRTPNTTSSSTTTLMSTSKPNQASTTGQIPTSESTSTATLWTTSNPNHASTTGQRPTSESTSTATILTTSKQNQALTTEQNLTTTKLKAISSVETTKQALNTSREPTPTYLSSTLVISPSTEQVNVSAKLMVSTELNFRSAYWPTQTVNLTSYSLTISTPETIATYRPIVSTTIFSALSAMSTSSLPQSPFSPPGMKTTRKTIKHTKYKISSTKSPILVSTFRNTTATSSTSEDSTSIAQSTPFKSTDEASFFNKLANVVAVSSVLGFLLLFGLLSFSFVLWKKCCKTNSVGSWSHSREKINQSEKSGNVSIRIPRY